MYANARGCDGGRVYYDGCSLIAVNGEIVAKGMSFSLQEVEVVTATVDLGNISAFRGRLISLLTAVVYIVPTLCYLINFFVEIY